MQRSHNIELRLLDCLVALVEKGSVTQAAESIGLSQPRMSDALRRLRVLFRDALLVRAGRRMVPTERAVSIAAAIRSSLERIDAALAPPTGFAAATCEKQFVMVMSEYVSLLTLPKLLSIISALAPRMSIAVKMLDPLAVRLKRNRRHLRR